MLNLLRHRAGLRGTIGVVAAYALALQVLFAGLAGAQMAAADPVGQSVICYGAETVDGDHGAQKPGTQRIHHVTCVVCGVVSLATPAPETATPVVFRVGVAAAYTSFVDRPPVAARRHDPKSAQGPPQTV